MTPCWVILQKRASRAGAQTSLNRLLRCRALAERAPVLVCGEEGWLTEANRALGLPTIVLPYPSSRSIGGRLLHNRRFASALRARLKDRGLRVRSVLANDHQEVLLALALQAPVLSILRSASMSARDFRKYGCARAAATLVVGDALFEEARAWAPGGNVERMQEGLHQDEFEPPKDPPAEFPRRILVLGGSAEGKGWGDLFEAIAMLEVADPSFSARFELTGDRPERWPNDALRSEFCFLGRRDDLPRQMREYALAVHPSRRESFGLAPVEALAAGVPVLCTEVGVISKLGLPQALVAPPMNPAGLSEKLSNLRQSWGDLDLQGVQDRLRKEFSIEPTPQRVTQLMLAISDQG